MPVAPYGTTNPRGMEPWQIESTLAPLAAGGNQAEAQDLLQTYQDQRKAAGNVYGEDLAAQHQYAYDALRQQMQEAYLKALPENAKAGTLGILASSPQYVSAFGGADPRVIQGIIGQQTRLQDATIAEKGGQAAWSLTNAGLPPDIGSVNAMTRLNSAPGTPIPIQVAQIKAASGGGGAGGGTEPASFQLDPSEASGGVPLTVRTRKGESIADAVTRLKGQGLIPGKVQPPGGSTGKTGLQPNQDTSSGTRVQGTSPGAGDAQRAANDYVENVVRTKNRAAYDDIRAAAAGNGGQVVLLKDANGNIVGVKGQKGTYR